MQEYECRHIKHRVKLGAKSKRYREIYKEIVTDLLPVTKTRRTNWVIREITENAYLRKGGGGIQFTT